LSRRVVAYYGLIRPSGFLSTTYEFAAEAAAPKDIGLGWEFTSWPNNVARLGTTATRR
jgi:hypothetical protein